jgi:hypothetical protein
MDPVMREYLDAMRSDMAALQRTVDTHFDAILDKQEAVVDQLEYQALHLTDLSQWKLDLEAHLAELQARVDHLQHAQSASPATPAGGAASSGINTGMPRGQISHDEDKLPRGTSAGALGSPPVPLVMGMISFQHPLAATVDPQILSSQIITGLGSNAPNFPFQPFSGDNPNLWMALAVQYFQSFFE